FGGRDVATANPLQGARATEREKTLELQHLDAALKYTTTHQPIVNVERVIRYVPDHYADQAVVAKPVFKTCGRCIVLRVTRNAAHVCLRHTERGQVKLVSLIYKLRNTHEITFVYRLHQRSHLQLL